MIAEQHWTEEEVTAARSALMAAGGTERLLGLVNGLTKTRSKGNSSKMETEIKDIINIVTKLEDMKEMPLVLACSGQINRCPSARGSIDSKTSDTTEGLISRMMSMEETMTKFMSTTTTQFDKLFTEMKKNTEQKSAPGRNLEGTPRPKKMRSEVSADVEDTEDQSDSYASKAMAGIQPLRTIASSLQSGRHVFQPGGRGRLASQEVVYFPPEIP